jgi:hypothetical protein
MTQAEFNELPLLLTDKEAERATGFSRNTLRKMVDNKVLNFIKPAGMDQGRYQKKQVADLVGFKI